MTTAAAPIVFGGVLRGTTTSLQGDITDNASLVFDQTSTGSFDGDIDGTGSLTKLGTGTVILAGSSSYSGGTLVSAGTLQGTTASLRGDITDNAKLTFDQASGRDRRQHISGSGSVTKIGTGTLIFASSNNYSRRHDRRRRDAAGHHRQPAGRHHSTTPGWSSTRAARGTYAGDISGTGSLTKLGTGTLILAGVNDYAGGTTVSAGTLQGTTDSLQGDITDNARLVFNQSSTGTYIGDITGTGSLTKLGAGTVILTGSNSYEGGTRSAGTLQGTTDSLQGDITDNARPVFDQSADGSYDGTIQGTGSLTKAGAGQVIFTGDNDYTGGTTIGAGVLQLGDSGHQASFVGAVVANGTGGSRWRMPTPPAITSITANNGAAIRLLGHEQRRQRHHRHERQRDHDLRRRQHGRLGPAHHQ